MAELRESFPVLENTTTNAGEALAAKQVGVAPGAHNGLMALSYRDASGNLVLPQLDLEGRILVSAEGGGTEKSAAGELAAGSVTMVDITSATVSLTNDKLYNQIKVNVSCFRDAVFNIVWVDNGVSTIIGRARVGSGQYSVPVDLHKKIVTAGATGAQTLKIQGQNMNQLSAMSAEISFVELP